MEQLRVYAVMNGEVTYFDVKDVEEAKRIIKREVESDLHNRRVFWNAFGLEVIEDGEWVEYYNEDGLDIMEMMKESEDLYYEKF